MLTDADLRYVREEFVPLAELTSELELVRARVAARELPAPPYPGVECIPADYFELPLGDAFLSRLGTDRGAEDLAAFMDGTYFVCLRRATPENIRRKSELVDDLRVLLAEPRPADDAWRPRLRVEVDELDELERPFSPDYDRTRFGCPPTRDELIVAARTRFADLF